MALSSGTAAQLLSIGIPADKHNHADLRNLLPSFDGISHVTDLEALAETVIYLSRHQILSITNNSWKSLPWGTHACLFYKSTGELTATFEKYFKEGLLSNERCVWIVAKTYSKEKAAQLAARFLAETQARPDAFEIIYHEDWYENSIGRFRSTNEIVMGWLHKIERAVLEGFTGVRVAGDAHVHPDDLKNFFDYEDEVNRSIGSLKIKALCTYCVPKFAADQINLILNTHQSSFGDFAVFTRN